MTLIESPNEARGLAVIAKSREIRPNKPLTTLINTHHHFDHSAGIRAAVSEGLTTVVTHRSNVAFYQEAMTRPHTLIPDVLSRNPNPPPANFVAVDDEMTLKDDTMSLVLYRIQNNTHADNNLMIYFPGARLLTQADIHMPRDPRTLGYAPWVDNLLANIKTHNLRIDRSMPLHGKIVPYSEFLQTVKDGFDRTIVPEPPPYRFLASSTN
jgi:glyoxylase-like metal-dependent hydrolase (beta-lactamase superfamily II)